MRNVECALLSAMLFCLAAGLLPLFSCGESGDNLKDVVDKALNKENDDAVEQAKNDGDYPLMCQLIAEVAAGCDYDTGDPQLCADAAFAECVYNCYKASKSCNEFRDCITADGSVCAAFVIEPAADDDNDDNDDTSDGTWTDSSSGLTWQVTPGGAMTWDDAKSYCDNLSLDGGGWRLPTISELRSLIRGCNATETGGSCGVTDSCLNSSCQDSSCYSCDYGDGPNNGCYGPSELPGECDWYWSSSPVADVVNRAWGVNFYNGSVYNNGVVYDSNVRCVR